MFRSILDNTIFDSILEQDMEELESYDRTLVDAVIESHGGLDNQKTIYTVEDTKQPCSLDDVNGQCCGDEDGDEWYDCVYTDDDDDGEYEYSTDDDELEDLLDDAEADEVFDEYNNDYRRFY